jgi:hypothetical protein
MAQQDQNGERDMSMTRGKQRTVTRHEETEREQAAAQRFHMKTADAKRRSSGNGTPSDNRDEILD